MNPPPVKNRFLWEGQEQAEQEVQTPTDWDREWIETQSIHPENTTHQLIEGDNLDVLQWLQTEYAERIKLIYIDPPYNTGQNFSYLDNFRNQPGEEWMSMMYPRLKLAHRLLRPDGAMFVSIDDHEFHRLRYMMDEIFGVDNFVANVIWRKKVVHGRGATHILPQTEYVLIYAKDITQLPRLTEPLTEKMRKEYRHADEQGPYKLLPLSKSGTSHSPRPNLVYSIEAPDGTMIPCPTHQWRWSRDTLEKNRDLLVFRKGRDQRWRVYTKQYQFLEGTSRRRTPSSYYDRYTTTNGTEDLKALFGQVVLDFPKPVGMIEDFIEWVTGETPDQHHIILDFFAGSGTTGEAVLRRNQADRGNRQFILVQIPAPTPPNSAAHRAGFATLSELCQERLRLVIQQLEQDTQQSSVPLHPNTGFRFYRLCRREISS